MIALVDIVPDEDQPRKNFSPEKLRDLITSIKKHGIINPLIVEPYGKKYLLEDGERRYRAAKELNLKEVPVVVVAESSKTERLIKQFHIQEQHQGWSAVEKAIAVGKLSKELGVPVKDLAEVLALPHGTVSLYVSFGNLLEQKEFEKNEISLDYAPAINNLKAFVKRKFSQIEEEFTPNMERALERAIIHRIKNKVITKNNDLLKLHDAVKVKPESIMDFIKDSTITPERLFITSKAKKSHHYRNIKNIAVTLNYHIKSGFPLGVVELLQGDGEAIERLKSLEKSLSQLLAKL